MGTYSAALDREVQLLLRWVELLNLTLVPQFIVGSQNIVADSLSRRQQVLGSEWTFAQEVVDELVANWPATLDLFATAPNYQLPVYFLPLNDPMAAGTDMFLQVWDGLQAYVFPPFALIRQVINRLRSSKGTLSDANRSVLASERMVSGGPESRGGPSVAPSITLQLTPTAPLSSLAPEPPCAEPLCLATI